MSGGDTDRPQDKGGSASTAREARLAEALRANLRRRKAAPAPPPADIGRNLGPDLGKDKK